MDFIDETSRLAAVIGAHAPEDGNFDLQGPTVTLLRRSQPTDVIRGWQPSSVCVVAQGSKRISLGNQSWEYDRTRMIFCSVDVPVTSQVLEASPQQPFLCVRVRMDPKVLAPLVTKVFAQGVPSVTGKPALTVASLDAPTVNAVARLVESLSSDDAGLFGPLALEEFLLRLLRGPAGPQVAQAGLVESSLAGVSRAITQLRSDLAAPIRMTELAKIAHMSVSSFHDHFKAATDQSPLQYLKALRLQTARNLLLTGAVGAKSAAQEVGYASPSQFSREYSRYFGRSPVHDIEATRGRLA